jgi:hypothetical protein
MVDAERAVTRVGLLTLLIGVSLAVAPKPMCRLLRLGGHASSLRVIGLADLALVPGLLWGRPRWAWMTGRAALNVVIAGHCLRLARRDQLTTALVAAVAMAAATISDGNVGRALRHGAAGP